MASPETQKLKQADGKIAPQHYDESKQDWDYSKGSDGALHVKPVGNILEKLDALNSKVDGIINGTTPASTNIKGSIVEYTIVDALAIRDINSHFISSTEKVSFGKFLLYAKSSLDVDLKFNIRPFPSSFNYTYFWDGSKFLQNDNLIIPKDNSNGEFVINSAFEWLDDYIIYRLTDFTIRLQTDEEPTDGSVTVKIVGVKW